MMKDQEKTNKIDIEVNIAGVHFMRSVPFQDQELTRSVEDKINSLYSQWRHSFPNRPNETLLAMMVYHYANRYYELAREYVKSTSVAKECLDSVTALLKEE
ncbi:MAG: cell division protein ZapA [Muribaculaceae bacterium]|nr:cell division protein ZapA [Muribaculaceae bacterium]